MPDTRITGLAAQTGAALADTDLFVTVDVSDTSMAATGTDKKITRAELVAGTPHASRHEAGGSDPITSLNPAALGGALRVRGPYPFTFNSPGILTVDGFPLYTPAVGEFITLAFLSITTAWNGTTPKGVLGVMDGAGSADQIAPIADLTLADVLGLDLRFAGQSFANEFNKIFALTTDSIAIAVSQDGAPGGPNPVSTQGAANAYFWTATPSA